MSEKWTDLEIKVLTDMVMSGFSDEDIASVVGRTANSVKIKRRKLGVTYHKYRYTLAGKERMRKKPIRENSSKWKGGRRVNSAGYIEVFNPDHPRARANGYVFEHMLIAEQKLGRRLFSDEVVHHIDHNKKNNIPSNLEIITRSEHTRVRHKRTPHGEHLTCIICGKEFFEPRKSHVKDRKTCGLECAKKLFRNYYLGKPRDYKPTKERVVNE